jgi:hypothetical protein
MTIEDEPESYMDIVDVDDRRLEIAKANLEKVDVLGLSERHDEFVDDLKIRFGFGSQKIPNRRVSRESWDAAPALRRRIAEDNVQDLEFYEFGRRLYEQRRQAVIGA